MKRTSPTWLLLAKAKPCTAIVPVGEVYDTGGKYKYRNLNELEVDNLFMVFEKHNGCISAISRDTLSEFKSRPQIIYYRNMYELDIRLEQFRTERIRLYMKNREALLTSAKTEIINQALEMIRDKEIDKVLSSGEIVTIQIRPTSKELAVGWAIIKTELGEPIAIKENIKSGDEAPRIGKIEVTIHKKNDTTKRIKN